MTPAFLQKRLYEGFHHRLRTFAGGRFASHCRPTSIALMLTEHCTARCVHCDIWKNTAKEDNPDPADWKRTIDDLREWLGPVHIIFTGGEALMKPYTVDLVTQASARGLFVETLTHGFWADQKKIERLALANPWRITISLDGLGADHDTVRGRQGFFEKTAATIATLERVRRENYLDFTIRLKFVIMAQNFHAAPDVVEFASRPGMEVFFQPIEQNYNTVEDDKWFLSAPTWPKDTDAAVRTVEKLMELKRAGKHIVNSEAQLDVMIPYFRNPDSMRVAVQSHSAHERKALCNALTMIEIRSNGDVKVCNGQPAVGNIKTERIRAIWENRPTFWEAGCCLNTRCTTAEKETFALPILQ